MNMGWWAHLLLSKLTICTPCLIHKADGNVVRPGEPEREGVAAALLERYVLCAGR
jgi:hypothetical protein